MIAGRADGLFVETLSVEFPSFDPRYFGAHERGAVLEIVRAIPRPDIEFLVMRSDSVQMLLPFASRRGIVKGSVDRAA